MDWSSFFLGGQGQTPGDFQQGAQYQDRDQIQQMINAGVGRSNYQAPQLANGPQDQFRQMQMNQANQLARIASGQQQGAGELAVQRQAAQANAAQQAQARMARGANSALAFRNAANNTASIGINAAGQGQQAALSDQQAAQGQLANALNAGRGMDVNIAGQNASNALQANGQNNQMYTGMLGTLGQMDANQLQAQMAAYNQSQQNKGIAGGLLNAGGQLGAAAIMSDERLKTDISDAGSEIDEMLDRLYAKRYSYKDEKYGKGSRAGIMAQDLAASKAGRDVVVETPDGLGVDRDKALSATLAATARLNSRLREVEGRYSSLLKELGR